MYFYIILILGDVCKRGMLLEQETFDEVVDIDNNFLDPKFCATIACDIYKHLRASEVNILFHTILNVLCIPYYVYFPAYH